MATYKILQALKWVMILTAICIILTIIYPTPLLIKISLALLIFSAVFYIVVSSYYSKQLKNVNIKRVAGTVRVKLLYL